MKEETIKRGYIGHGVEVSVMQDKAYVLKRDYEQLQSDHQKLKEAFEELYSKVYQNLQDDANQIVGNELRKRAGLSL